MNNCRYNQYQYTTCDMEDGYPVGDSYTVTVGYYPESPHTRGSCIGQVTNFESAFAGLEKVPYKPAFSPELETAFIQEALPSAPNTVLFNVLGYQIQQQDKADPALTTQVLGEIKNPKRQYQQEEFDYLASEALPEMPDEVVTHVGRSAFGPSWTG
jgi:hypothetical protein